MALCGRKVDATAVQVSDGINRIPGIEWKRAVSVKAVLGFWRGDGGLGCMQWRSEKGSKVCTGVVDAAVKLQHGDGQVEGRYSEGQSQPATGFGMGVRGSGERLLLRGSGDRPTSHLAASLLEVTLANIFTNVGISLVQVHVMAGI